MKELRRLVIYLVQRYCPFNVSVFQLTTGIVTAFLLGAVLILGGMSSRKVTEVVTRDFNQQQLVLARHAAGQVENNLNILKRELSLLALSPSLQYFEKVSIGKRMGITYSSVKDESVLEIRYVEAGRPRSHFIDAGNYRTVTTYPEDTQHLRWAGRPENRGRILLDKITVIRVGDYHRLTMKMAAPVWQVSVDETNPVATHEFSGVLVFVVDVSSLTGKVIKDIRSGKTGYAWLIDGGGTFLHHPERGFIGENAFEARKEKKHAISFARINEIQKNLMLAGKEGTSWYVSGWHRGKEGEMKKLIAYSPIHLEPSASGSSEQRRLLWSVAVAAPISEVEDAIRSIHVRQFALQSVIVMVIMLGGLSTVSLMIGWSRTLELEVNKKTSEFKRSEQRYRSLVENAEDIIFTVDYEGNYISINNYGARLFGKDQSEIVGRNMAEILPWPGAEVPLMAVREVFDTRKGQQVTHPLKLGEHECWFNTNFRRLFDEEGKIYAVLGISRDITDRKKMEETSYHTEKLASIGTLAAGVAHEINNPLGVILGFTDLMLEKAAPGTEEHTMLMRIGAQGLKAKHVVENLLSFARYPERKEETVDVNQSIESVLSVVENTLLMNKITLIKELGGDLPAVKGYAEELQQVFFNVITNAVSAMGKRGGVLTVSTAAANGAVEIKITDTGGGIRKEYRHKVFDPLFTTKKIGEGTGLGLSVSYGIVIKHGGSIGFETKTEEESKETGTAFMITLPAVVGV